MIFLDYILKCKRTMVSTTKKKEGFSGQKAIVIPRPILTNYCHKTAIINSLYITDIGYYPKAEFHYRERQTGSDQHILIYCMEGCGKARVSHDEFEVQPGEYIVIPAKASHYYSADEDNPWTIYWLHFKGTNANDIIDFFQKKNSGYKGYISYNDQSISFFNEMYGQLERGYSMDNLLYSNMCLWHYFSTFMFNDKYISQGSALKKDEIDNVIDFLRSNINQALTIDQIAASVNLSISHFSYLFKKKTGFTAIEYFNHLKIQKACQYILFSNMRINEIALELGFNDPSYFTRLFTKTMNVSPNQYREKRVH